MKFKCCAHIGSQTGYAIAIPLAHAFGISTSVGLDWIVVDIMIAFFILMMDKLDKQIWLPLLPFGRWEISLRMLKNIQGQSSFWPIALLCAYWLPSRVFHSGLLQDWLSASINENTLSRTFAGLRLALGRWFPAQSLVVSVTKRGKSIYRTAESAMLIYCICLCYSDTNLLAGSTSCAVVVILGIAFLAGTFCQPWPAAGKIFR